MTVVLRKDLFNPDSLDDENMRFGRYAIRQDPARRRALKGAVHLLSATSLIVVFGWGLYAWAMSRPVDPSASLGRGDWASILQGTLGVAGGIAAAVLALRLAALADDTLTQQQRREDFTFVDAIVKDAAAPILATEVATVALCRTFTRIPTSERDRDGLLLRAHRVRLEKSHGKLWGRLLQGLQFTDEAPYVRRAVSRRMRDLAETLRGVSRSTYASHCWFRDPEPLTQPCGVPRVADPIAAAALLEQWAIDHDELATLSVAEVASDELLALLYGSYLRGVGPYSRAASMRADELGAGGLKTDLNAFLYVGAQMRLEEMPNGNMRNFGAGLLADIVLAHPTHEEFDSSITEVIGAQTLTQSIIDQHPMLGDSARVRVGEFGQFPLREVAEFVDEHRDELLVIDGREVATYLEFEAAEDVIRRADELDTDETRML